MVALAKLLWIGNHGGRSGCGGDVYRDGPMRFGMDHRPLHRNHCDSCGATVSDLDVIKPEDADELKPGQDAIGGCGCGGVRWVAVELRTEEAGGLPVQRMEFTHGCTGCDWPGPEGGAN
ncbi:MAG TPA: hypothetical protein VGK74_02270 [Symbiobacteriaceae bacterium]|jgi:hypothetical protein